MVKNQSGREHDDVGAEMMKEAIYASPQLLQLLRWRLQPRIGCRHSFSGPGR